MSTFDEIMLENEELRMMIGRVSDELNDPTGEKFGDDPNDWKIIENLKIEVDQFIADRWLSW